MSGPTGGPDRQQNRGQSGADRETANQREGPEAPWPHLATAALAGA